MQSAKPTKKGANKMNNPMTYIQNGDYLIPDLKLSQQRSNPLGKYGRMRKTYLKEHRPCLLYTSYDATVVLEDDGQYANFKLEFDQRKGGSR